MRALLHADYVRVRFKIILYTITFMQQHPDEPFLVDFDYSGPGDVAVEVRPGRNSRVDEYFAAQWRRVWRSGRMTLHVMRVALGRLCHRRVFPLRSTSSRVYATHCEQFGCTAGLSGGGPPRSRLIYNASEAQNNSMNGLIPALDYAAASPIFVLRAEIEV
jgi:hypothetical protein